MSSFEFALRTGGSGYSENAREILLEALELAGETGMASLWWIIRLTVGLLDDLWNQSLHAVLPNNLPDGGLERYADLRSLFIASLFARDIAEVELWPVPDGRGEAGGGPSR